MDILITGPDLKDPGGVAGFYNSILPHLLTNFNYKIFYMAIGSTKGSGRLFHPLMDQINFYKNLNVFRPEIVHVNPSLDFKSFIRDGLLIRQANSRGYLVVVFFRGWDPRVESKIEKKWLWFFNLTYKKADAFIVLASEFKNKLMDWRVTKKIYCGTTTVSINLIEGFSIKDKHARMGIVPCIKVLFLARLIKEKGILETIEAIASLRSKGLPISLTVAGDGECMSQVRNLAHLKDPSNKFLFIVGDVRGDKKKVLLAEHHIYCFPSLCEGMPNSVLEAMAFGMPVVTCPTGGLKDFFVEGKMGYFVKSGSSRDIADVLEKLIDEEGGIIRISSFNHRYAQKKFLSPMTATFMNEVYQEVYLRTSLQSTPES